MHLVMLNVITGRHVVLTACGVSTLCCLSSRETLGVCQEGRPDSPGAGGRGVVTVLVLGKQVSLAKDILARRGRALQCTRCHGCGRMTNERALQMEVVWTVQQNPAG